MPDQKRLGAKETLARKIQYGNASTHGTPRGTEKFSLYRLKKCCNLNTQLPIFRSGVYSG
jgi:hypothetical protein